MHNYIVIKSWYSFLLLSECNNINDYRTALLNNHFPKGSIEKGHKVSVISLNKKDSVLNWLLHILIRSHHLSSVSSIPLTSDLSYVFFLFLLFATECSNTISRQVAQKRYRIFVFVYDNGKETEWGKRRGTSERKRIAKNVCPCLAQHEKKSVQSGQSTNYSYYSWILCPEQSHHPSLFQLRLSIQNCFF